MVVDESEMILVHSYEAVVHRGDLEDWRLALHAVLRLLKNTSPAHLTAWENGRAALASMSRHLEEAPDAPD